MKDPITTPGKTYAVTSPNGCTVTTEDGLTLAEIEAGKQGYFVAVGGKVQLSDDSAILTRLFKLAPYQKLRLLGVVGGDVPAWFKALKTELTALLDGSKFKLAWLASEKKLVVHTDRVSDELLAAVKSTAEAAMPEGAVLLQYNHHIEVSWRDINKYAECVTVDDLMAVNPDFRNDLTGDGSWVYPLNSFNGSFAEAFREPNMPFVHADFYLPSLTTAGSGANWHAYGNLETLKIIAPKLRVTTSMFVGGQKLRIVHAYLPEATDISTMFYSDTSVEKVTGFFPKVTNGSAFLNIGSSAKNRPEMSCELEFPKLSSGSNMFSWCRLDKPSTLCILNSIPSHSSGSHTLTIGIHVDHKTDDEVLAAIAAAEERGWTIEVQWNGTPTAQAAGTFAMGTLIYAKVGEMELPDGSTEQYLDWGHYVTDWEARGYEQFRSLSSAYRYFGLPDETLTNN